MSILSSAINNTEFKEELSNDNLIALYELANRHDLAHIVAYVLKKNGLLPESEIGQKLQKSLYKAAFRIERIRYQEKELKEALNNAKIPFIMLKGAVIRNYYPEIWMRTSCDIDVLVKEADIEAAVNEFEKHGYIIGKRNYHDILLTSPANVHIELHFSILENMDNIDSVLKNAWDYAVPLENYEYEFTKEFFLFHIHAHMYYHFVGGGCGIRSLVDLWIIKQKWQMNYETINQLLKSVGIYTFAEKMDFLVEQIFSEQSYTLENEFLLSYIIRGGVYGTKVGGMAFKKQKNGNILLYSFKRIFLPYNLMKIVFPILRKTPILLPIFWVVRIFQAAFGTKRREASSEINIMKNITQNELEDIGKIKEYLDI